MKILLFAYGNPLRRDDGAGLALGEKLKEQLESRGIEVQHTAMHQLVPELAAEIADSNPTAILFADATAASISAGIEVQAVAPQDTTIILGHHCSPNLVMYMAQHLYGVQVPARLVTVKGTDFGHGEGFSPEVAALLARPDLIHKDLFLFDPDTRSSLSI